MAKKSRRGSNVGQGAQYWFRRVLADVRRSHELVGSARAELGRPSYAMFNDLLEYPWVIKPVVRFKDVNDLIESLHPKVITPAEKLHSERQELLEQLFP